MASLQAKIVRKTNAERSVQRNTEKENLQVAQETAEKVVSDVLQMALTKMLADQEEGRNSKKLEDALNRLRLEPYEKASSHDIVLGRSKTSKFDVGRGGQKVSSTPAARPRTTSRNKDEYVTRL